MKHDQDNDIEYDMIGDMLLLTVSLASLMCSWVTCTVYVCESATAHESATIFAIILGFTSVLASDL